MKFRHQSQTYLTGLVCVCLITYCIRQHIALQHLEERLAYIETSLDIDAHASQWEYVPAPTSGGRQNPNGNSGDILQNGNTQNGGGNTAPHLRSVATKHPRLPYSPPTPKDSTQRGTDPTSSYPAIAGNKLRAPIEIELNTADSALLVRVPGIGVFTAKRIINFRQVVGGFFSPWQLRDVVRPEQAEKHLDKWCSFWFTADTTRIRRIDLSTATYNDLNRHPYIDREQARQLINLRDRHPHPTLDMLRQLPAFSDEDIARIKFYLKL